MLSDAEIRRQLLAIRFSSKHNRNARRAPSINAVATLANLSRQAVYIAIERGPTSRSRSALSEALENLSKTGRCQGVGPPASTDAPEPVFGPVFGA